MNTYQPKNVMNGTWGELWVRGNYLAEVTAFNAKVALEKSDINMTRKLSKGSKVTGYSGTGTIKLNKVTSFFQSMLNDSIKHGKQFVCQIVSKLSDPDAIGSERVVIRDATFDEVTLADWEAKKNGEESIPFTFTDWDFPDMVIPSTTGAGQ